MSNIRLNNTKFKLLKSCEFALLKIWSFCMWFQERILKYQMNSKIFCDKIAENLTIFHYFLFSHHFQAYISDLPAELFPNTFCSRLRDNWTLSTENMNVLIIFRNSLLETYSKEDTDIAFYQPPSEIKCTQSQLKNSHIFWRRLAEFSVFKKAMYRGTYDTRLHNSLFYMIGCGKKSLQWPAWARPASFSPLELLGNTKDHYITPGFQL